MARTNFQLEGIADLTKGLKERATLKDVKDAVRLNGSELDRAMTRKAEFTQGYQTGTTKRSIILNIQDKGFTAKVAPGTEYAGYVEYGTRFMAAQPFVRPSFYQQKEKFKRDMARLMR